MVVAEISPTFIDRVRAEVVGMGEDDTHVLGVLVALSEDASGLPAIKVTLDLPLPKGSSWDAERLLLLRRAVRGVVDEVLDDEGIVVDGTTTVDVTTGQAGEEDVALVDVPEPDELADTRDADGASQRG